MKIFYLFLTQLAENNLRNDEDLNLLRADKRLFNPIKTAVPQQVSALIDPWAMAAKILSCGRDNKLKMPYSVLVCPPFPDFKGTTPFLTLKSSGLAGLDFNL